MTTIVSIDPGAAYGLAVCVDGTIVYSGQHKMGPVNRGETARAAIQTAARYGAIDLVTVEMPAVLGRASSFESLAGQWSAVLAWWHAAEALGLRVCWVNPASWRALMIRRVKATLLPHQDVKAMLQLPQAVMTQMALGYGVGNDECSAIWMALWAWDNLDALTPEAMKATKAAKREAKAAKKAKAKDKQLADAIDLADRVM